MSTGDLKQKYRDIIYAQSTIKSLKDKTTDKEVIDYCDSLLKEAEKNNPIEIKPIADMNVARSSFNRIYVKAKDFRSDIKTLLLKDGRVLIMGGTLGSINNTSVEIFNPKTEQFELVVENISKYISSDAICVEPFLLPDGRVYFKGAIFNPETNKFSKSDSIRQKVFENFEIIRTSKFLKDKRSQFSKNFIDGKILFKLNCQNVDEMKTECSEVLLFNPLNEKLFKPGKLKIKRYNFTPYLLEDNKVLIIGGEGKLRNSEGKYYTSFEIYDPNRGETQLLDKTLIGYHTLNSIQLDNDQVLLLAGSQKQKGIKRRDFSFILNLNKITINQSADIPALMIGHDKTKIIKFNNKAVLLHIDYPFLTVLLDLEKSKEYKIISPDLHYHSQNYVSLGNNKILVFGGNYIYKSEFSHNATSKAAILSLKNNK